MSQPELQSVTDVSAVNQQVWEKWLAKNRDEEKAYAAKWGRFARTLLFALVIASVVCFFVR